MAFSYNWLKTYFDQNLPSAKDIESGIIFHSFEVEGMEDAKDDTLLDIKILPDRAHDCLCHTGIAGEVSAIFNLPKRNFSSDYGTEIKKEFLGEKADRSLSISIECPDLCRRYIGRIIENISVGSSPDWLKSRLEAAGQRSISNIVDATNYVMFDLGQPLHAFDADKVKGNIIVRRARAGEKMTTLDGKELVLTEENMLISDEKGPLALAGIKGGNRAEVDANTKNIILESANFHPVNIRRTSAQVGIRTDASKRFENELSPEVAGEAMDRLTSLLSDIAGDNLKIGDKVDQYPAPLSKKVIETGPDEVNAILGIEVPKEAQENILKLLDIEVEEINNKWKLIIPFRRVDLEIKQNIAEEIGRIYGYEKIPSRVFENKIDRPEEKVAEKRYRTANKIREILIEKGFSEVYGYAFDARGEVEVANPLALDRPYLRTNLAGWLKEKLNFNLLHVLFDNDPVKIFEIGHVFTKDKDVIEETNLAIAVGRRGTKPKIGESVAFDLNDVLSSLRQSGIQIHAEVKVSVDSTQNISYSVLELSFEEIASRSAITGNIDLTPFIAPAQEYKRVSAYPRIVRDIALWVPEQTTPDEVASLIRDSVSNLLVEGPVLFDRFPKDGRVSLAFRQVFQSYEKTLSDDEVNAEMDKVTVALEQKGWEVRK